MKKHKLLKDLPLAKAGTIVTLEVESINGQIQSEDGNEIFANINMTDTSKWLEKIQEPKSIWNIKKQDEYYTIINGIIHQYDWLGSPNDKRILEDGNIFLTREEAEQKLNKQKAIQRIKKFCWENDIELADRIYIGDVNSYKYEIVYLFDEGRFSTNLFSYYFTSLFLIFKNKNDAQKVIYNCEADLHTIFDV